MICKSIRQTDDEKITQNITWLFEQGFITEDEKEYLNGENGIRKIRNFITHRDVYEYCFEDENGIAYSFADTETWDMAYDFYAPRTIEILCNAIVKSNQ